MWGEGEVVGERREEERRGGGWGGCGVGGRRGFACTLSSIGGACSRWPRVIQP